MIHECVDQYACLAANINFNLEGLRNGFWQLTIDGLSWGAIYALVAVGYTLVFGVLRLINFAHSEIFMLGMFGALLLSRFHPGLHPQRQRLQPGHPADCAVSGHRNAFRDAGVGLGGGRAGVRCVPAVAKTPRPLADVPDHRDRHVLRAAGVRALRAAEDAQGLRRQQRPAADHLGAAQDSVHDLRGHRLQRHAGDHRFRAGLRAADGYRRSTGRSSAAASAPSPRTRPRRR